MKPTSLVECLKQDKVDTDVLKKRLISATSQGRQINSVLLNRAHSTISRVNGNSNETPPPKKTLSQNQNRTLSIAMSPPHNETKPIANKLKHRFYYIPYLGTFLNWTYKVIALPFRFYKLQQDFSNRASWIDHYGNFLIQTTQNHNHQALTFEKKLTDVLNELQALRNHTLTQANKIEHLESKVDIQTNENRTLKTQLQGQISKNEQLKKRLNSLAQTNRQPVEEISKALFALEKTIQEMSVKIAEFELISNSLLEKELSEKLAEILATGNKLEATVATLQLNQQNAAHTIHHASSLAHNTAHKVHIESEEIRIRLLRLERALKHYSQPAAFLGTNDLTPVSIENLASSHEVGKVVAGSMERITEADFDYFMFTHKFRGSVEEIKRRQSVYLEYFKGRQNVVDLGCGRGEFLSLLSENGIPAYGIDLSEDNIDYCLEFGLNVKRYDIFNFLTSIPDESLDGIFSAQVIEHLTPTQIIQLVNLCNLKLKKDGVLILESVNTNCIQALADFYLDPTHIRPVPPDLMQYLLQSKMFKVKPIKFTTPISPDNAPIQDADSGALITNYVDYAVIGYKA